MASGGSEEAGEGGPAVPATWTTAWLALLFAIVTALTLAVYRDALRGEFVSDDIGYFESNPYTRDLGASNVLAIVDPRGAAKLHTANYAPVHLLAHAIERQVFGDELLGYHVVNVLVHALNSVLLTVLLLASGVPGAGALLGGAIFAVHPANVEAVAWISQLKTSGALAFALGALLARPRRPALATLLFTLGLLTKASAAFALPMAAAFAWLRRGGPGGDRRQWAWLGAWALILALYAVPQTASFAHIGGVQVPEYEDPWVQLRTVAAVGMRYVVMATTSYGVAAFQEPPLALSPLDGWWLASLPVAALVLWRLAVSLWRRSDEAAWWIGAAAAFFPVSQIFPFLHPVADRYLYFILPGLIGAPLVGLCELLRRRIRPLPAPVILGAVIGAATLLLFFALHSAQRAKLWRSETRLLLDAAEHYPDGEIAHFMRARRAAQTGDAETALRELREVSERGFDRFMVILGDPGLAPLRGLPGFRELVAEIAGRWIRVAKERGYSTQPELRVLAHAHLVREEYAEAERQLQRALEVGGPQDAQVRAELAAVRRALAELSAGADGEAGRGGDHRTPGP